MTTAATPEQLAALDSELKAVGVIASTLSQLDHDAGLRVMRCVFDLIGRDINTSEETDDERKDRLVRTGRWIVPALQGVLIACDSMARDGNKFAEGVLDVLGPMLPAIEALFRGESVAVVKDHLEAAMVPPEQGTASPAEPIVTPAPAAPAPAPADAVSTQSDADISAELQEALRQPTSLV